MTLTYEDYICNSLTYTGALRIEAFILGTTLQI